MPAPMTLHGVPRTHQTSALSSRSRICLGRCWQRLGAIHAMCCRRCARPALVGTNTHARVAARNTRPKPPRPAQGRARGDRYRPTKRLENAPARADAVQRREEQRQKAQGGSHPLVSGGPKRHHLVLAHLRENTTTVQNAKKLPPERGGGDDVPPHGAASACCCIRAP